MALQKHLLGTWGRAGARSLGIFNCRHIGGPSSPWSVHAEGRALDLGVPSPPAHLGELVLAQLLEATDELLQRIIWDHRIYDLASPEGRPYTGQNPHTDHLHIELSWAGAKGLIALGLDDLGEEDGDAMPILIVAHKGAQWCVSPDLTSRVGLAQTVDVAALMRVGGGKVYIPATLTPGLMDRIPEVSALG